MRTTTSKPFCSNGSLPEGLPTDVLQQSTVWARFMAWLLGKENVEFWETFDEEGQRLATAWVYLYRMRFQAYWVYVARGPVHTKESAAVFLLEQIALAHTCAVWVRWDPLVEGDKARTWLPSAQSAHASFHPKSTLLLDLTLDDEALLAQMKSKGRYNIRLARKKGVEVFGWTMREGTWQPLQEETPDLSLQDAVQIYTDISQETTARDGFSGHGARYFSAFLTEMPEHAQLFLARAEGEWIAGGLFTTVHGIGTYYYGASSNRQRSKMAPYLVQWTAIQYAKQQGCHAYDFLGVATPDSTDPSDLALLGVTDFKLKFGGMIRTGGYSWEKVQSPLWFFAIRTMKRLRGILSTVRKP